LDHDLQFMQLGFSGNLIKIYLFLHTPITFILIILSIANCIPLIVGIDPTLISSVWCKLRVYIGQTSVLFCWSCACLVSINCFLLTYRELRWRRLVSRSICCLCITIAALFWLIHGLFTPLLVELII